MLSTGTNKNITLEQNNVTATNSLTFHSNLKKIIYEIIRIPTDMYEHLSFVSAWNPPEYFLRGKIRHQKIKLSLRCPKAHPMTRTRRKPNTLFPKVSNPYLMISTSSGNIMPSLRNFSVIFSAYFNIFAIF